MAARTLRVVKASVGKGIYRIDAEAKVIGDDIIVSVWGGTQPHIGSVAMAVPRPSLEDNKKISATSSVFNFVGHKDDVVAKLFSEKIASSLNKHTIITAGIHVDRLTRAGLEEILKNCKKLGCLLVKKLETCK